MNTPSARRRLRNKHLHARMYLPPQDAAVLEHIIDAGSITNVEANAVLRCRSVSRRITAIREWDVPITKEYRKDTTGQRYVRYVLKG